MKTPFQKTPFHILAAATLTSLSLFTQSSHAALLVYESFDYSTGNLAGQNGGTGFTGAWSESGDTGASTVQAGSLSFSNLETDGNKAYLSPSTVNSTAFRSLDTTLSSGTYYMSFLMDIDQGTGFAQITLRNGTGTVAIVGQVTNQNTFRVSSLPGGTVTGDSGVTRAFDTPYLMVLRVDFNASGANEVLSLYVNPTPGGTEPGTAQAVITSLASFQFDGIGITAGYNGGGANIAKPWVDEIRIGTTWADVTPVPEPSAAALLSLGGVAAYFVRRRRIGRGASALQGR